MNPGDDRSLRRVPPADRDRLLRRDTAELAREYEQLSLKRQFKSGKQLIELLRIVRGERVLDIGCGTGLLAAHVADIVGDQGYVLGIDPLKFRIELARTRARPNLEFCIGDAYALGELSAQVFDVVYLNAVFHWLSDKPSVLAGIAGVLRAGGRLGIAAMAKMKGQPAGVHAVLQDVLSRPPYVEHQRHPGNAVDDELMPRLLEDAGFEPTSIVTREAVQYFPSGEAAIAHSMSSSAGNFLGHLPDDLRARARVEVVRGMEAIRTPKGIERRGRRIVVIARRR